MYEQYYNDVIGDQKVATDLYGDEVLIKDYLKEDKDNILVKVGDIIFLTERPGVKGLKPLYPCAEAHRLGTVDRNTTYINITSMGCPCQGVADYKITKTLVDSPLQVFNFRYTGATSWPLVSDGVLNDNEDWVSDLHCQDGSEQPICEIYIPNTPEFQQILTARIDAERKQQQALELYQQRKRREAQQRRAPRRPLGPARPLEF